MNNRQRPDALDARWVFRGYAVLAGLGGFVLLGWGQMWFGDYLAGQPSGKAALIRVLGSILIAAACCAAGFAVVDSPPSRRNGLFWFATGHAIVFLVVLSQRILIWGPGLGGTAAKLLIFVTCALFYLWSTSEGEHSPLPRLSLFGDAAPASTERLRSQYEQQIREAARLEERNRLARDLHDSIKQQVFVIQTAAATAQARFDGDQVGAREALEQIRASAREAMTEMQVMLDQLRAVPLENAGLIESLKKQCAALGFRTGAQVDFKLGELPPSEAFPPGAHEAILRAAQEALANVGRHARAGSVTVVLDSVRGQVELKVQDDGAGFDPEHSARGQGIANMRARVEEFGGKFELISRPGNGTSITLSFPYMAAGTPVEYRNKALWAGVALMFSIAIYPKTDAALPMSMLAAFGVIRYTVAYRRLQTRSGSV